MARFHGLAGLYGLLPIILIVTIGAIAFAQALSGWLAAIIGGLGPVVAIVIGLIPFFLVAGRMAYVLSLGNFDPENWNKIKISAISIVKPGSGNPKRP